jgi:hypothetical protein
MVSVFSSSAVECGFEHRSGQTKDYKIGMCCFSAKHAILKGKSKVRIMCVSGGIKGLTILRKYITSPVNRA